MNTPFNVGDEVRHIHDGRQGIVDAVYRTKAVYRTGRGAKKLRICWRYRPSGGNPYSSMYERGASLSLRLVLRARPAPCGPDWPGYE